MFPYLVYKLFHSFISTKLINFYFDNSLVPLPMFSFTGSRGSFLGDSNFYGKAVFLITKYQIQIYKWNKFFFSFRVWTFIPNWKQLHNFGENRTRLVSKHRRYFQQWDKLDQLLIRHINLYLFISCILWIYEIDFSNFLSDFSINFLFC